MRISDWSSDVCSSDLADHTGGNLEIKAGTGATVTGPRAEETKIPGIDRSVGEGDIVRLGDVAARVIEVPAHTAGPIAYHLAEEDALFCGDTLFAMGRGRLFGGPTQRSEKRRTG